MLKFISVYVHDSWGAWGWCLFARAKEKAVALGSDIYPGRSSLHYLWLYFKEVLTDVLHPVMNRLLHSVWKVDFLAEAPFSLRQSLVVTMTTAQREQIRERGRRGLLEFAKWHWNEFLLLIPVMLKSLLNSTSHNEAFFWWPPCCFMLFPGLLSFICPSSRKQRHASLYYCGQCRVWDNCRSRHHYHVCYCWNP